MVYRQQSSCARHPETPALAACDQCEAAVCAECASYGGLSARCSACGAAHARARHKVQRRWRAAWLLLPAGLALAIAWVRIHRLRELPPEERWTISLVVDQPR